MDMSQSRDADEIQQVAVKRSSRSSRLDVWLTLAMVTGAVLAIAYFVSGMPKDVRPALLLAGTTAAVLGWGAGILFSPSGGRDQLSSRGTGRLLTGLIVGFLVAWFWRPIKELFTTCGPQMSNFLSSGLFPIAAISLIIFLLALITTYILRGFYQD
jgi:hypothetical protein